MPKPEIYGETIYVRLPRGTKDAIDRVKPRDETQADFLRQAILAAIDAAAAGARGRPTKQIRKRPSSR